jgi:ABC-2 type transport system permease protein
LIVRRVWAQVRKELAQIFRDRLALVLALVLPVIVMSLITTAISLTPTGMPLIVRDYDSSPLSRAYIDAFRSSLTFEIASDRPHWSPEKLFQAGVARAIVIIPQDFSRNLYRNRPADIQAIVDATDTNTATQTRGYIGLITRAFSQSRALGFAPSVRVETRLWYNPGRESMQFFGPGAMVFVLSMLPPLLAALAMAREGEQKTIVQVYVSGISALEYLLGKTLAYIVVSAGAWLVCVLAGTLIFQFRFAGDPTPFLSASLLYLFCAVAFGISVGAAIPNQSVAIQVVAVGGFLLAFLLSGFIFPVQNIPPGLRWISNIVQARYYIEVARDAFLQGGGWPAVWPQVLIIGLIGLVYFGLAWFVMRRMQLTI